MLEEAFPDVVAGYWQGYPHTEYANAYIELYMQNIIDKLGPPDCHSLEPVILTTRQVYLATDVINKCNDSKLSLLGDAIHQFADCIDNFREEERKINYTEHLLYYNLAHTILITVQKLHLQEYN